MPGTVVGTGNRKINKTQFMLSKVSMSLRPRGQVSTKTDLHMNKCYNATCKEVGMSGGAETGHGNMTQASPSPLRKA